MKTKNFILSILLTSISTVSANAYQKYKEPLTIKACNTNVSLNKKYNLNWFQDQNHKYIKNVNKLNCKIFTKNYRSKEVIDRISIETNNTSKPSLPDKKFLNLDYIIGVFTYYAPTGDLYTKYIENYNDLKRYFKFKKNHIKNVKVIYKNHTKYIKYDINCIYDGGNYCYNYIEAGNLDLKKQKKIERDLKRKKRIESRKKK